jgi:hypothetical protein
MFADVADKASDGRALRAAGEDRSVLQNTREISRMRKN